MTMKKINGIRRCRLCASEEDVNRFSNIFDSDPELELEIKITKLLPVVVMPWDPMPHIICRECIGKLNSFNDFYEASLRAERFLRGLYPSAPENRLGNLDPVVRVLDTSERTPLKLPLKKRQGGVEAGEKRDSSELLEILRSPEEVRGGEGGDPKRTLNCFIVNHITTRDSVFTCRDCYRTFTKQSSALAHPCVGLEDCGELEGVGVREVSEKSLPPLKIRLFSVKSGLFVCYLCQTSYEDKTDLVEHIKGHFVEGKWGNEAGKKCGRPRGKRKARWLEKEGEEEEEDWEETYRRRAARRKRKKCQGPPRKRGRGKSRESAEPCQSEGCVKCGEVRSRANSSAKETVEQMTQYSEASCGSAEGEAAARNEKARAFEIPTGGDVDLKSPEGGSDVLEILNVEDSPRKNAFSQEENPSDSSVGFDNSQSSDDPVEIPVTGPKGGEGGGDDVTVLEVINNRVPTSFSSCVFCDKMFATREALAAHKSKHLSGGQSGLKPEGEGSEGVFLCSGCGATVTGRSNLLEHELYHRAVESDPSGTQRKIRIALGTEFSEQEQESQKGKGRGGFITITVTSSEKKIPQIEFI